MSAKQSPEYGRAYRAANRERIAAQRATYRASHREEKRVREAAYRARRRAEAPEKCEKAKWDRKTWYLANRERLLPLMRYKSLRRKYGITKDAFDALLLAQGGACAICRDRLDNDGNGHVDHDHSTGKTRAILCGNCNRGLGCFRDSPEFMRQAAGYVEFHRGLLKHAHAACAVEAEAARIRLEEPEFFMVGTSRACAA